MQGGRSNPSLDNEFAIAMAKISQTRILDGFINHEHENFHPSPFLLHQKGKIIFYHASSDVLRGIWSI
jgi:hypothetical protein